jgi:hypothetical protein
MSFLKTHPMPGGTAFLRLFCATRSMCSSATGLSRVRRLAFAVVVGLAAGLSFPASALAGSKAITLADGSRIWGDVVSLSDGVYTIRTESLGTIQLPAAKVSAIGSAASASAADGASLSSVTSAVSAGAGEAIDALTSGIMSNTEMLGSIMKLQSDPQMRAVLADPEVRRAVQAREFDALSKNPKIQALMRKPEIRAISGQVQ